MKTQSEYENAPSSEALSIHGESEHYLTPSEVLWLNASYQRRINRLKPATAQHAEY